MRLTYFLLSPVYLGCHLNTGYIIVLVVADWVCVVWYVSDSLEMPVSTLNLSGPWESCVGSRTGVKIMLYVFIMGCSQDLC